jgi:predicted PurR-regulated permease PerM
MDYESLVERINDVYKGSFGRTVPGRKIYNIVSIFNRTFKQFLRGQLFEAVLVAVLSVIALWIAGVNYYGIIGVIAGICNLVPFVGPWIGAIVAAVVSLLGGGYMTAIWAVVAMVIVQQIDNHLLAPKIVGDSVGLHPVITMVVLIIGADVGGIVGMLLAVPVAATVKNILVYRKERREAEEGAVIIDGADTETKPAP